MRPNPAGHRSGATVVGMATILLGVVLSASVCRRSSDLSTLTNQEFWSLVERLSEPPGKFEISPNLVSNESHFAESVRVLRPAGGVYVGVGPEQNFSYITRVRPRLAFIIDIRRENRNLHLLYKALFELSTDRTDFVSRLFSRPSPPGLSASASVDEIFRRFEHVAPSRDLFAATTAQVRERLVAARQFPLSRSDFQEIDRAFAAFFDDGPEIHFWGSRRDDAVGPSYRQLMTARDIKGLSRSYLADEDGFRFIKELHARNLIVPIVGDFSGVTTVRAVGDFVRERHDRVQAFYGSNVGIYLTNEQARAFCANLSTLPVAPRAVFIESNGVKPFSHKLGACR